MCLITAPLAARIGDFYDALRTVLVLCIALAAFVTLGYLSAEGFWLFLAVSVTQAAMLAPLGVLADALTLGAARRQGFEYGWVRGTGSAAFILGILLSGQAVAAQGLGIIVLLQASLLALAAVAARRLPAGRYEPRAAASLGGVGVLLRMPTFRTLVLIAALLLLASGSLLVAGASAAEALRVGKAVPEAFSFVPLDIGMRKGLFANNGLDIESIAFTGDARMQQAMASDSLDVALGSGPAMAFIVKGAPIKAVAAMAGPPLLLAIVVRPDGPKTAAELRAKKISVSTAGSLTYWLVSETSRRQGWGPKGIEIAPMGALPGQIAAMKRGDIDGAIMDIGNAFELEKRGDGRILVRFTDIKDFHIHVIFATDTLIARRPQAVRAFLKGWFETIAFMRKNKPETVAIASEVTHKDAEINARVYDELMPMFSDDGRFNASALATLAKSYVELQLLPQEPDMAALYTEAFLPK